MKRTSAVVVCALLAGAMFLGGCRVERTRGQRSRAREIQGVLNSEAARLAESDTISREDFERLVGQYNDLTLAVIRSAEARPIRVQDAEDELNRLAIEVKDLEAFKEREARAQKDFERKMDKGELAPWKQWRGRRLVRERRKAIIEQEQKKEQAAAEGDS
ncbi:MAG: hypothetical protein R3B57_12540 [Phycisphaerales bacterium]